MLTPAANKAPKSPQMENNARPVVTSPSSPISTFSSPKSPGPKQSANARRVRSILMKIQCCLATLFILLVASTMNVARLSGHIMEAVDLEVEDSKASVLGTLHKFGKLRHAAFANDDDKYVKITKEDLLKMQQGNYVPPRTRGRGTARKDMAANGVKPRLGGDMRQADQLAAQQAARHPPAANHQAAHQMEHDNEMDEFMQQDKLMGLPGLQDEFEAQKPYVKKAPAPPKPALIKQAPNLNPVQSKGHIPARTKGHYDNRWEMSHVLPDWMKDYFVWHEEQRMELEETNWNQQRFLVLTCLTGEVCGNVAQRMRPIPAMLRVAYNTQRMLLIHWSDDHNNHKLETFLEPPHHGGLDWTVPEYMLNAVTNTEQHTEASIIDQEARKDASIVTTMVQDADFAESYYGRNKSPTEVVASRVFHDVFNILFKPTSMLYERVEETQHTMGIFRGNYAAVHIDYEETPKTTEEKAELAAKVQNAMNCISNLRPGGPFLVAAQTFAIASEAVKYAKKKGVTVGARQVAHDTATLPHDIWNSFLEIFFMANARCVSYSGQGAYGQLGFLMGYDYNCRIDYREKECIWTDTQADVDKMHAAAKALPAR